MLYAHTPREGSDEWHGLEEHLREVSRLAGEHAGAFGAADLARWIGAYHDGGKASPAFQAYLQMCRLEPDRKHKTTDHKGAGTWAAQRAFQPLAFVINGHHGGLRDKAELGTVLKEIGSDGQRIEDYRRTRRGATAASRLTSLPCSAAPSPNPELRPDVSEIP
ncbi:MAG TPA: CRISPR-associated endonuclease Cas3'' [Thermomicrobiales bacterium]|nr:CRISPR-associated endonuclease Cas3'' [Thermomicrobiales bacterium]